MRRRPCLALLAVAVVAPRGVPQEPLPPGAVARLGSAAGKPERGWAGSVVSADGRTLVATHSARPAERFSFRHLSLYDPAGLRPRGGAVAADGDPGAGTGTPQSLSRDGLRVACVGITSVNVFDTVTGKRLAKLPRAGLGASLSADGRLVALGDSQFDRKPGDKGASCAVFDVDSGKEVRRVAVPTGLSADALLSPDGKLLLVRGSDAKTYAPVSLVFDVGTGAELHRAAWPAGSAAFTPDSAVVAYADSSKNAVTLADAQTGKVIHTLADPAVGSGAPAFSPDGTVVAVFGAAAGAKVGRYDAATGKLLGATARPADVPAVARPLGLAVPAADKVVALAAAGRAAFAWDAVTGKLLSPPDPGHAGQLRVVAFAAGGKEVVTAADPGDVCRWDAATGAPLGRFDAAGTELSSPHPALSPDGSRAFAYDRVFDVAAGTPVGPAVERPKDSYQAYGAFPAAGGSGLVLVWTGQKGVRAQLVGADGKPGADLTLPPGASRVAVRRTPDGKRLVVASTAFAAGVHTASVQTFDAATGAKAGELVVPKAGAATGFALLDDVTAVLGTGLGRLLVLDLAAGTVKREIPDADRVACAGLAAAPGGKLVAVLQTAKTRGPYHVRFYDPATGEARGTVGGSGAITHGGEYNADTVAAELLAFSPDGTRLVTPATPTTALVWQAPAGKN